MSRVVAMEDAAERGQFADLQWFWHHMERTEVTVQAALARRLAFIDAVCRNDGADLLPAH
jgi:hypothetical protein